MAAKTFNELARRIRKRDSYWTERIKIDFAEEVARLMERQSVNRTQLAERIGSSAAYVTKALRGDTNFTIESMVKLVRALGGTMSVHVNLVSKQGDDATDSVQIAHNRMKDCERVADTGVDDLAFNPKHMTGFGKVAKRNR